ncbi:hypothetical protein Tco_0053039 [Tanacetum coccineum]
MSMVLGIQVFKPTTVCDRESDNSKENTDDSLKQQHKTVTETSSVKSPLKVDKDWKQKFFYPANHVREEEPKKARLNTDAPIIEDWVSDDEEEVEPIPKVEKKTAIPTATKKESVKPEKSIRMSVSLRLQWFLSDALGKFGKTQMQVTLRVKPAIDTPLRELVDQAWEKHYHDHFCAPTAHDMEILIKTCLMPLARKTQNDSFIFVHELKQEMHYDLRYVESLEKEINELESVKAEFSNMYDILLQECVSSDVMCSYLHSLYDLDADTELQCLYLHKVKECECLAQKLSKQTKTVSKEVYTKLLRSYAKLEKHSISLELALQQCQEQMKNDTVCKEKASNVFLKECEQYFKIQDLKAQLQDKNIAIRKPTPFSNSLERKSFSKTKSILKTSVSEGLSKPVTTQILPQTEKKVVRNTNVIKPGMYQIDIGTTQTKAPQLPQTYKNTNPRVSTSTGVIHITNVSRPRLRSTQMKDKVMPNNSQVKFKKTEVEDRHKISSISNKTKFVTASKKPKVVPISSRKPKSQANKSAATPPKKTVASLSTIQKSKSYYRMLYEKTSKALKWWIEQQCPSGYKWVPKTKMKWVPKVRNENVKKRVSFAIDNASRITNIVQLILFIVDSGCTKHMTSNLKLLCNFVEKYLSTVRFGNDQFVPILGYGDLVQ